MPKFVMTWPTARTFANVGEVEPGATIEADENPDPAFFHLAKETKSAGKPAGDED